VDVEPDGRALILYEGIVRARYRKGLDAPTQKIFHTPDLPGQLVLPLVGQ
jgi:predicted acyl esterase